MSIQKDVEIPQLDQSIWLSYAAFVKDQLLSGQPLSADQVVYICPPTYVAMGISSFDEDINYQIANNAGTTLEDNDGPLFTGGSQAKYFDLIQGLAFQIDPSHGGQVDPKANSAVVAARNKALDIKKQLTADFTDAQDRYADYTEKQTARDLTPKPFEDWARQNAPQLRDNQIGLKNASIDLRKAWIAAYGEQAFEVLNLLDNLEAAGDRYTSNPGLNMPACSALPINAKEVKKGDIFYTPAYDVPGYKDMLSQWESSTNKDYIEHELKATAASSHSWSDFGHSESSGSSGNNIWVIFNNTSSHSESTTSQKSALDEHLEDITFKLKIREMKVFSVRRGDWDRPSIRDDFVFTRDPKQRVIPDRFLIGYGVGLDASFGEDSRKEARENYEKIMQDKSAGMSIFGIQIGSATTTTSVIRTAKDDIEVTNSGDRISIPPEKNLVPVLLGVLGRKVNL